MVRIQFPEPDKKGSMPEIEKALRLLKRQYWTDYDSQPEMLILLSSLFRRFFDGPIDPEVRYTFEGVEIQIDTDRGVKAVFI